jgi:hypothetical protein
MATTDLVSTEFFSGIVEIERDGMIHRGTYQAAAAIVTLTYGCEVRHMQMRRRSDTPYSIAQMLLLEIVAKIHQRID